MSFDEPFPIHILGLSARGAAALTSRQLDLIVRADALAGGRRHLAYFPDFSGRKLAITGKLEGWIQAMGELHAAGKRIVVLASGDPLFYGIGKRLIASFPPEQLIFHPAPTAIQLAFAALKEPWEDAVILSAHSGDIAPLIPRILTAAKAAILTNRAENTPDVVARALLAAGLPAETPAAVCENLGGAEERIVRGTLAEIATATFAPLNVFVVWPTTAKAAASDTGRAELRRAWGQPDDAFATHNQLITKREVRLLALAELALSPGNALWDIGAGSGAVGIEAARAQPSARVYAVEKRERLIPVIQENLRRFPAPNYRLVHGLAPDACAAWPDPDAVFIGGSGGRMDALLDLVQRRLRPEGRLVITLATLESIPPILQRLPDARLVQVVINRGAPLLDKTRLQPLNPVFMIVWERPNIQPSA